MIGALSFGNWKGLMHSVARALSGENQKNRCIVFVEQANFTVRFLPHSLIHYGTLFTWLTGG